MMSSHQESRNPTTTREKGWLTPFPVSMMIFVLLLVVFGWQTMQLLADVYEGSEDYSHGFVVPLVSLYAAYEIRKRHRAETYQLSWWGVPVVISGTLLLLAGMWYRYALLPGGLGVQSMVGLGLLLVILGLGVSTGGKALVTRFAFPLFFLSFCVPLPEAVSNQITVPLRSIVSNFAAVIVRLFGVPVYQDGNVLQLAVTTLGVADACSGIRSLWIMLATAVACGYFLRCGTARTLLLSVLAVPLAVFFNIIRVVSTALLVIWRGPHYAQGTRHEVTGAVVFLAGVITLVLIAWLLARDRQREVAAGRADLAMETSEAASPWQTPQYLLMGALGIILILGAAIQPVIARHYIQHMPLAARKSLAELPARIGPYSETKKGEFVESQLDQLRPTDRLSRTYRTEHGSQVNLWSLYWEPYRGKKSAWNLGPHTPDGCYPAAGWKRVSGVPAKIRDVIPGRTLRVALFTKESRTRLLVYVTSDTDISGGLAAFPRTAAGRLRQMLSSWSSPLVERGAQYIVTAEAEVTSDPGTVLVEVMDFMKQLAPLLPQYGISG